MYYALNVIWWQIHCCSATGYRLQCNTGSPSQVIKNATSSYFNIDKTCFVDFETFKLRRSTMFSQSVFLITVSMTKCMFLQMHVVSEIGTRGYLRDIVNKRFEKWFPGHGSSYWNPSLSESATIRVFLNVSLAWYVNLNMLFVLVLFNWHLVLIHINIVSSNQKFSLWYYFEISLYHIQ